MNRCIALALVLLAGCGPPAQPEEEVTATWTSGDDAPLSSPDDDTAAHDEE